MGRQVTVQVALTVEIDDELELAEAGFRAHRQRYGVLDDSPELTDEMRAVVDAAIRTPEAALSALLASTSGPLHALALPGARVAGVAVSGPVIGEGA